MKDKHGHLVHSTETAGHLSKGRVEWQEYSSALTSLSETSGMTPE